MTNQQPECSLKDCQTPSITLSPSPSPSPSPASTSVMSKLRSKSCSKPSDSHDIDSHIHSHDSAINNTDMDDAVDIFDREKFSMTENDDDDHNLKCIYGKAFRSRRTRSLYGVSPNCKFGPKGALLDNSGTVLTIPDPGSQKLNWHKPPLTVMIVKKLYDESIFEPFKELVHWLIEAKNMVVFLESSVMSDPKMANDVEIQHLRGRLQTFKDGQDDLTDKIDFIICLGGDGTLLHASSLFQQSVPPVMSFHLGSLGFLTPFQFQNFREQVTQVLEGNAGLLLRYRLKCLICKMDLIYKKDSQLKTTDKSYSMSQLLVLNEVVVDRGPSSYLSNIDLFIEGRLVTSVQGDGLIISTPTGSTAYALAAGVSMMHPNVPAIMITPICPHSLSFRPVVVPAGVEITVKLSPDARNTAWVSFDGRGRQEIQHGDIIRITTAQYPLPSVCAKDQIDDWFDSLAECLHWNVRRQQRPLYPVSSTTSFDSIDQIDSSISN